MIHVHRTLVREFLSWYVSVLLLLALRVENIECKRSPNNYEMKNGPKLPNVFWCLMPTVFVSYFIANYQSEVDFVGSHFIVKVTSFCSWLCLVYA